MAQELNIDTPFSWQAKHHCLWFSCQLNDEHHDFPFIPDSNMFKSHVSEASNHPPVIKHGNPKSSQ